MYQDYRLSIAGAWRQQGGSRTLDVLDPSSAEVIARVPDASAADVDRAVNAARTAFDDSPWKDATAQDRGRILLKLANIVRRSSSRRTSMPFRAILRRSTACASKPAWATPK